MPTILVTSEAYSKLVDEAKSLGTTIQYLASKYALAELGYEDEDENERPRRRRRRERGVLV